MPDAQKNNITMNYFQNMHQINDAQGRPLTNVYWSNSASDDACGCVFLIHGYGGSPVEPCLKLPMQYAQQNGFDVVAVEGIDLSATAGQAKELTAMTLDRQKQALSAGIRFSRTIPDLNTNYNIAWLHSISCRALSDLMVDSPDIRNYFNEIVLNNPYFLPPPKVQKMKEKVMQRDPSGETWAALTKKPSTQIREIESVKCKIPTCLYNLVIPLPPAWQFSPQNLTSLSHKMSHFVRPLRMYFVLGTADNMADYNQNVQLFRGLDIPHKQLILIQGANHSFENALSQYADFSTVILDSIRTRRLQK